MARLILVPSLQYGGAASQARNLALQLRHEEHDVHVIRIGSSGLWEEDLRGAGVTVHALNWTRSIELTPLWQLNALLNQIHPTRTDAFGLESLRTLALAGRSHLERTWMHRLALDLHDCMPTDRLLCRSVEGATATTRWEASLLERAGFRGDRLSLQRPVIQDETVPSWNELRTPFSLISVCRLECTHGPRDAMWTMDMLAYPFSDCRLTLVGEGSLAADLHELEGKIYYPGRTTIVPSVRDVASLYAKASICWITAKPGHGLQAAVEAQAHGCPIVAYDQPALRELLCQGETAFLVPQGDMVGLARSTFALLKDSRLQRDMSVACRQWAREHFTLASGAALARRIPA